VRAVSHIEHLKGFVGEKIKKKKKKKPAAKRKKRGKSKSPKASDSISYNFAIQVEYDPIWKDIVIKNEPKKPPWSN